MTLSLIVAVAENGVIGNRGELPWRLSADLRRFRKLTMGHAVIMGRKTYESLGRPLPGRTMIVITRQRDYAAGDALVAASLEDALQLADRDDEPFVIGGAEIFRAALPQADRIYQTIVHARPEGDTFLPDWDPGEWRIVLEESHGADEKNEFDCTFRVWERKAPQATEPGQLYTRQS
jgi:dihydrofolate reductase